MKLLGRMCAGACAAALVVLSATPALAATTHHTDATGSAVTVTLGGSPNGSGTYRASNDGSGEKTSGNDAPQISVLNGQNLLSQGTLHQDAAATPERSQACAGLAGQGATLVSIGEAHCLTGGQTLSLDAQHVDFSHITLAGGTALQGVPLGQIPASQVTGPVGDALKQALTQLGNPVLDANFGAIRGVCAANPSGASGDSELANAKVTFTPPGQPSVILATLPAHPAPNTKITADTNKALDSVIDAFRTDFEQSLNGQLSGFVAVTDAIKKNISDNAVKQFTTQAKPLLDQLVTGYLNKQSRSAHGIDVTALDLTLLPAAGAQAPRLQVGHVTCAATSEAAPPAPTHHVKTPQLPTAVNSGYGAMPAQYADHHLRNALLALTGALLVLGGGGLTWRRLVLAHR